jgi:hypothetical protein
MKFKVSLSTLLLITCSAIFAQSDKDLKDVKYRRSSLHTILIEAEDFPMKEKVLNVYNNLQFPDKYENHTIGEKSFDPKKYALTKEERETLLPKKSKLNGFSKGLTSDVTGGIVDSTEAETPFVIEKYFKQNKIANKLVAKWFDRKDDGTMDVDLISTRGLVNASFLDAKKAAASAEGDAILKTAGFELIDNTFVVVNKLKFIANEPVARAVRDVAIETANSLTVDFLKTKAIQAAEKMYERTKEGYSVWTNSYLYKLKWDDATSATFYEQLYVEASTENKAEKIKNFDNSDLFKLEYVGTKSSSTLVTFSLKEKRTEDQIVDLSVTRNIDNVYAKLQKEYDAFKVKTPLYTGNPITAKIGLKEGLEAGDKFEVLEPNYNKETGVTTYKKVGSIKVNKKLIWDNRYNTEGAPVSENEAEASPAPAIDVTTFDGGDKFYSGMLIRQIK